MASNFRYVKHFDLAIGQMTTGLEQNIERGARALEGEIKRKIASGSRSGKEYKMPDSNTRYTASAEGEAPYNRTGTLLSSITHTPVETTPEGIVSVVGSKEKYSARLEFGFVGTDKLGRRYNQGPRPYFRSTFEEFKTTLEQIIGTPLN